MSIKNRRNQLTWDPPLQPESAKRARPVGPSVCGRCLADSCDMCVRAGCYHVHGPEVRSHGLSLGHVEAAPSAIGPGLRTEVDR